MRKTFGACLFLLPLLMGCAGHSLIQASEHYKTNRDFARLKAIYDNLSIGMSRSDVKRLLGEPDYSPTDGQYYYLSDRKEILEQGMDGDGKAPVGIVIEYRDKNGEVTTDLQQFWMGPIGE